MEIKFEKVNKCFGEHVILNNVSFSVDEGSNTFLIAESGHGRTITMKMIAGLEPVDSGSIYFNDKNSKSMSPKNKCLSLILDKPVFFENKTIDFNLNYAKKICNSSFNYYPELERLDLNAKQRVKELSFFKKLHLQILRARIKSPKILLIDNVLSELSKTEKIIFFNEINCFLDSKNTTVIIATNSDNYEKKSNFDILFLNFGVIIATNLKTIQRAEPEIFQECRCGFDVLEVNKCKIKNLPDKNKCIFDDKYFIVENNEFSKKFWASHLIEEVDAFLVFCKDINKTMRCFAFDAFDFQRIF